MKNSIMKKTWGILLGFGVSLATAAFVLTGCDLETTDPDTGIDNNLKGVWYASSAEATSSLLENVKYDFSDTAAGAYGWKLGIGTTAANDTRSYKRSDDDLSVYENGTYKGLVTYKVNGNQLTFTYAVSTGYGTAFTDLFPTTETFYRGNAPGGNTTGGDVDDLIAALGGASYAEVNSAGDTVTLKAPVTNPGSFTIPDGVTLVVGSSTNKLTLVADKTYVIDGTLQTPGGQLLLASSGTITISGDGTIEKTTTSGETLTVNGADVTITDVTVKGYAGSAQPVIVVQSGSLTLNGADVTGNTGCTIMGTSGGGAGIRINGGTVTLEGGAEVYGNSMTQSNAKGAGVYLTGGTLNIKNGRVYGYSTWGESFAEANVAADYDQEDGEKQNKFTYTGSSDSTMGAAIYWKSAATVKVATATNTLTEIGVAVAAIGSGDDRYIETATGADAGDKYTEFTIHASGNQWWNKAAR